MKWMNGSKIVMLSDMALIFGKTVSKKRVNLGLLLQGGLYMKVTSSSVEGIQAQRGQNEIIGFGKDEREEGELSPSKNSEGSILGAFGEVACGSCNSRQTGGEQLCVVEVGRENDANADDEGEESAKGSSDSENGYKIAEVSATDSADREERSPGDHDEDEDHDENDNKDASEPEEEGVADIHENEGMVAFSGHVLHTVKPLTTKLPAALPVKERNSEIFYGNDSFYLLFRLHQVKFIYILLLIFIVFIMHLTKCFALSITIISFSCFYRFYMKECVVLSYIRHRQKINGGS